MAYQKKNINNNEDKDLVLLVNENNNHYNIIFYKYSANDNSKPKEVSNNKEKIIDNLDLSFEKKEDSIKESDLYIEPEKEEYECTLKDLSDASLDEILDYYNCDNTKGNNLSDIYFYLYHI